MGFFGRLPLCESGRAETMDESFGLHAGKPESGPRPSLTSRRQRFRDMDMTYWLETAAEIQAL